MKLIQKDISPRPIGKTFRHLSQFNSRSQLAAMTDLAALDFALRTAESVAFALHAVIGCTEALHGIGKHLSEGARKKLVT